MPAAGRGGHRRDEQTNQDHRHEHGDLHLHGGLHDLTSTRSVAAAVLIRAEFDVAEWIEALRSVAQVIR
jgi:hypothetical protein